MSQKRAVSPRSIEPASARANRAVRIGADAEEPATVPAPGSSVVRSRPVTNDRVAVRRGGSWLERFENCPLGARASARSALQVDTDELDPWRHAERRRRLVGKRDLQKFLHDRCGEMTTGGAATKMTRLVVAKINSDDNVRCETDEPCVLFVVRGPRFPRDRLSDLAHHRGRAALNDAFHHRRDLIGSHRIENLLAPVDQ